MLRIAIISLLVANLLLLGFQGSRPAIQPETIAKQKVVEDPGVPTIHLFSEMVKDQGLMSGNRHCFSVGPFHSAEDKNETRVLLENVSANISERETQALVEKGYWVFMPPYESLLEANQELLSLQALGLKDIVVIYNGEWKNAVSLGYFLRQENALRRKKDLEDRGFAPSIRVQRQSESRYWLDYEQSPGSGLFVMDMKDRPNDFMQRSLPCPDQNPFEITASVPDKPTAEVKPPQEQILEDESQPQPEEINEPQQEENNESPQVETSEPAPVEISESQPVEGDGAQSDDGDGSQSNKEIDPDPEENIDTTPTDSDEAVSSQIIVTEPENTDGSQSIESDSAGPEENVDNTPPGSEKEVPEPAIETEPEADDGSQPIESDGVGLEENIDSTPVDSDVAEPEPAIETEPDNSVGTGPVISFGAEPGDGDETGLKDSEETEPDGG